MIGILKMVSALRRYFSTSSSGRSVESLEVRLLRENNFDVAKEFLERCFYERDPLHNALKLHKHKKSIKAFEDYVMNVIKGDKSLMMLNSRKQIIGVCLNRVIREHQAYELIRDDRLRQISDFLERVDEKCNLFQKFGVNEYMKLEMLTVDPITERSGIDKKLLDVTRYLTIENKMKLMRMDCTSLYTAKIASKLGFTPVFSVKYKNYRLGDQPVFKVPPPHTQFAVYIQPIDEEVPSLRDQYLGRHIRPKPLKENL